MTTLELLPHGATNCYRRQLRQLLRALGLLFVAIDNELDIDCARDHRRQEYQATSKGPRR